MPDVLQRHAFVKSFEAKSLRSRSLLTRIADKLTAICGSTHFLFAHIMIFVSWFLINTSKIPFVAVFDPQPFGLLTTIVSLEAIFLSIFVLVSQNRSSYIDTVREEVHMTVNLIAEEEITKILSVLAEMRTKMGIIEKDEELDRMLERIDTNYIERSIAEQLARADKPILKELARDFPDILTAPITMIKNAKQ